MKYSKGDMVENTYCQFDGRDEMQRCRNLIAPYPYAGTILKTCCETHKYAYALSYSVEEVQSIIRFKIGNNEWKHPLRFTDIVNATKLAVKGASIEEISKQIYEENSPYYLAQISQLTFSYERQRVATEHIKKLLTAFFRFPIVWDRFFRPKLNAKIPLHSSIVELGNPKLQMCLPDRKMIYSDLKYNELSHQPIALSWGLTVDAVKQIDEEYTKLVSPSPANHVTPTPVSPTPVSTDKEVKQPLPQPEQQSVTQPAKANSAISKELLEAEVKKGNSVLIDINGIKCKLSPIAEENKKAFTEFLPLSQRLINVLIANDLTNLSKILDYFSGMTREEFIEHDKFLKLHNFGRKSAREIFEFLDTMKD